MRLFLLLATLAVIAGFFLGQGQRNIVSAQTQSARCTVTIPHEWGEFKGFTRNYYAFEDQTGTVRFVAQLPCGIGIPQIALEFRRE